ncbi:hypothetical protein G0Q06_03800 [Puniceicoccales bacterium CK1056]|uniref:Uncharacterized protein n=1 Tax=Oceanipulchritudo coccoides TaxID=2706888 RepID=A0A6B2M1B0_9BACT|nr:glycoside hydrolase family 2 TIM barrel-domain containing protein [Oceanipulchritudo coccoides]NDV61565.1 hypothetical protein [Oceanipulchritudo coccoides]
MKKYFYPIILVTLLVIGTLSFATETIDPSGSSLLFEDSFEVDRLSGGTWSTFNNGEFVVQDGVLRVTDGWAVAGGSDLSDYMMKFRARSPEDARQVQIWAGFRHHNRDFRYVVALRGGANNHLYLARYGAEGYDKILDLTPLDFSPAPGTWYDITVAVMRNRIAVYLNGEDQPRILVHDNEAPISAGGISLGGSYLPTEFDQVTVSKIDKSFFDGVEKHTPVELVAEQRETKRKMQRAEYRPFYVPLLYNPRNEFLLNGNWLFIPDYESEGMDVFAKDYDDRKAHVIDVPNFWVPFAAWLEGETMSRGLNKGQNDKLHRIEEARCKKYTFDSLKTQSAWYRHYIDFPEDIHSKEVVIDFQGIALVSTVYFNGEKIHDHIGMYSPQKINVTDLVKPGRNVIVVQCWKKWEDDLSGNISPMIDQNYTDAWNIIDGEDEVEKLDPGKSHKAKKLLHQHIPHGFYNNSPAGIWRDVKLVITEKIKIDDFYFKPSLEGAEIDLTYTNHGEKAEVVTLHYEINNKTSGERLCGGIVEKTVLDAGEKRTTTFQTPTVAPELWAPGAPNLYRISFQLTRNNDVIDEMTGQVGFRTIEVEGAEVRLNGKPFWIRGANHTPGHMKPYDEPLARKFMKLALEHNVVATRTHCSPYSDIWLDAADEIGVLISFEGPFPWLMLRDMPSDEAIEIWKREMGELVKANRNRPAVFLWTMNNEMKFYVKKGPDNEVLEKGIALSEGIKLVRKLDPTRPVIADSSYYRKHVMRSGRYERIIQKYDLDDGDLDDPHAYFGWYNRSFFHFQKGEFAREFHTPGRALMGQEVSTGYPRADDALPSRFYLFDHQTPQTTVGKDAYEESNPEFFIERHSMLTKGLVEMFRRVEHTRSNGLMVFAFHTWFYNNHEVNRISPTQTAMRLKLAYEPILASAELLGRHLYAGDTLTSDITLLNGDESFRKLHKPVLLCQLVSDGRILTEKELPFSDLPYYQSEKKTLTLLIPEELGADRLHAMLVLRVLEDGHQVSKNEYDLTLATRQWAQSPELKATGPYYSIEGDTLAQRLGTHVGLSVQRVPTVESLVGRKGILLVAQADKIFDYDKIKTFAEAGGYAILLNNREKVIGLAPELVQAYTPFRQEIVTMNRKESPVFSGLQPLDLAWFSDNRNVPFAATGRFSLDRFHANVTALAETLEWHGYLQTPLDYREIGGVPLFELKCGDGKLLVSELRTDAIDHDPINARVIANILKYNFE